MNEAGKKYFVAGDYDLTLRLQNLFHETVTLQTKFDNAVLRKERVEFSLKLKEVHNEISVLVKQIKQLLSDAEITNPVTRLKLSSAHSKEAIEHSRPEKKR